MTYYFKVKSTHLFTADPVNSYVDSLTILKVAVTVSE